MRVFYSCLIGQTSFVVINFSFVYLSTHRLQRTSENNLPESPLSTIEKLNHNRDFKVPVHIVDKMIQKLEIPTVREAHDVEYVIA